MTIAEMRARYLALMKEGRSLLAAQNRTAEQNTAIENKFTEARSLANDIKLAEEADAAESEQRSREQADQLAAEQRARAGRPALPQPGVIGTEEQRAADTAQLEQRQRQHQAAFRSYLVTGNDAELRAQSIGTLANGGYAIPTTLVPELERALLSYGGLAGAVRQLTTSTGEQMNYPVSNNTSNAATVIAENTEASEVTLTMALKALTVANLTTGVVKVPRPLLQDPAFSFEAFVREELGESYGRGLSKYVTGTALDSNFEPFVSSITLGATSVAPTAIGLPDIAGVFGAVDPGYAADGSFVMNRRTQIYLSTLRNELGAPIFQVDGSGLLTKLFGQPIVIDLNMPDVAAGNRAIAFGNLNKYILRKVPGMEIMRLDERFATLNQVAFLGFFRAGSRLLDAGTHPIQALQQHA